MSIALSVLFVLACVSGFIALVVGTLCLFYEETMTSTMKWGALGVIGTFGFSSLVFFGMYGAIALLMGVV